MKKNSNNSEEAKKNNQAYNIQKHMILEVIQDFLSENHWTRQVREISCIGSRDLDRWMDDIPVKELMRLKLSVYYYGLRIGAGGLEAVMELNRRLTDCILSLGPEFIERWKYEISRPNGDYDIWKEKRQQRKEVKSHE